LYERVKSGELSANAAAIEAGWRKRRSSGEPVILQSLFKKGLTDD